MPKTIKTVASDGWRARPVPKLDLRTQAQAVVAADNTAGSAREVAEANDLTRGGHHPRLAAEIYGLNILKENVEDDPIRRRGFVVLSREKKRAPPDHKVVTFVFRVRADPGRARPWR